MFGSSQADMVESEAFAVYRSVLEDEERIVARLERLGEYIVAQIAASRARHAEVARMLNLLQAALKEQR